METVRFVRMEDGTREDYELLSRVGAEADRELPRRLLEELRRAGELEAGFQVSRFQHSLQTATRASRDGADEETVVCALLHDIGDGLAPGNHSALAASILRPYVSEANHWMVLHHGLFQGYYYLHHYGQDRNLRDKYKGHPHYDRTVAFCRDWDQASFDPSYDTLPLETFAPLVERIFAREPKWELG